MPYYRTCSHCGANLDPGERCDCIDALKDEAFDLIMQLTYEQRCELLDMWKRRLAPRNTADQSTLQEAI